MHNINNHHSINRTSGRGLLNAAKLAVMLTIFSTFSGNDAIAQNTDRDKTLYTISQILKEDPNTSYGQLLNQRDILLTGYGIDINNSFVQFQKKEFLEAVEKNQYGIGSKVYEIKQILGSKYGISFVDNDPVKIVGQALQQISKGNGMGYMKKYTDNLSGNFDINFVNAYGCIQSKYPSTHKKVGCFMIPNWELDGETGAKTLDVIISILNNTAPTNTVPSTTSNTRSQSTPRNQSTPRPKQNQRHNSTTTTNSQPVRSESNGRDINLGVGTPTPRVEQPRVEQPRAEQPGPEQPKIEHPRSEQPRVEQPRVEQPRVTRENDSRNINLDLDESMFTDEIGDIIESMSWDVDILSQRLSHDKLNGISYADILMTVNSFEHAGLKKAVMYHLLNNDIISAQKILGLDINCHSMYPNYKAGTRLGSQELQKMAEAGKYRRYCDSQEILGNKSIPNDVKDAYKKFLTGELDNKGMEYSIVSKTDYRIYLFSADHYLLSRQNTILGSDMGDARNSPSKGIQTTPGGIYQVGNKFLKSENRDFVVNYGSHYIVLIPMEDQYNYSQNYTMGVHGDYKGDKTRKLKLESNNTMDHRSSNGCINVDSDTFGEIYNHLQAGAVLYVTFQPNS